MMCCVIERCSRKTAIPYATVYKTRQEALEGLNVRCKELERGMSNPAGERGHTEVNDPAACIGKRIVYPAGGTGFDPVELWLLVCYNDDGEVICLP